MDEKERKEDIHFMLPSLFFQPTVASFATFFVCSIVVFMYGPSTSKQVTNTNVAPCLPSWRLFGATLELVLVKQAACAWHQYREYVVVVLRVWWMKENMKTAVCSHSLGFRIYCGHVPSVESVRKGAKFDRWRLFLDICSNVNFFDKLQNLNISYSISSILKRTSIYR